MLNNAWGRKEHYAGSKMLQYTRDKADSDSERGELVLVNIEHAWDDVSTQCLPRPVNKLQAG